MSDIHILPIDDLREHVELRQCPCRPRVDDVEGTAIVVHNSYDGREYFEGGDQLAPFEEPQA